jgi:glycopeptide antibiotics resistance protein
LLTGLFLLVLVCFRLRRRGWIYLLDVCLLGIYLLILMAVLFFPIPVPTNWPANLTWNDTLQALQGVNLIPFNYNSSLTPGMLSRVVYEDIFLNILLTVPFGTLICFLLAMPKKRLLFTALGVGLALEGTQLLLKLTLGVHIHSVDITDVLMNALGVWVGAGLYRATQWMIRSLMAWRNTSQIPTE